MIKKSDEFILLFYDKIIIKNTFEQFTYLIYEIGMFVEL